MCSFFNQRGRGGESRSRERFVQELDVMDLRRECRSPFSRCELQDEDDEYDASDLWTVVKMYRKFN